MQPCERTSNCSQKRVRPSSPPRLPVHSVQLNRAPTSHAESPSLPPSDLHWRSVAHELFKSLPTAFSEHPSVMQNNAKGEAAEYLARAKESAVASSTSFRALSMSFCQQCPVGSFCSNLGMTEPVTCPDGTYSSQLMANNINTCKICPVGYSCTAGILSQVVCSGENYYSANVNGIVSPNVCYPCPEGSVCLKSKAIRCLKSTYQPPRGNIPYLNKSIRNVSMDLQQIATGNIVIYFSTLTTLLIGGKVNQLLDGPSHTGGLAQSGVRRCNVVGVCNDGCYPRHRVHDCNRGATGWSTVHHFCSRAIYNWNLQFTFFWQYFCENKYGFFKCICCLGFFSRLYEVPGWFILS